MAELEGDIYLLLLFYLGGGGGGGPSCEIKVRYTQLLTLNFALQQSHITASNIIIKDYSPL